MLKLRKGHPRPRHCGLSHHSETVLGMLLASVTVPAPAAAGLVLEELREACGGRHGVWACEAAVDEYAASGLPASHISRSIDEDRLFFAAALAAGGGLAAAALLEEVS